MKKKYVYMINIMIRIFSNSENFYEEDYNDNKVKVDNNNKVKVNNNDNDEFFIQFSGNWWNNGISEAISLKRNVIVKIHYIRQKERLKSMYIFLVRYKKKLCKTPTKFKCEVYLLEYNQITSNVIEEYLKEEKEHNIMSSIAKEMLILFLMEHQKYLKCSNYFSLN